jgi:hypothetical protein
VPKAPVVQLSSVTQPVLPTIPNDQYLAKKAALAKNSQSSFPAPPQIQTVGPIPRAPGSAVHAPIASVPAASWQGIQQAPPQAEPASPDLAVGPNDVLMVINSSIAQFDRAGALKSQATFQNFFASVLPTACPSGGCLLFDPCIRYDQLHGRFLFLATSRSPDLRTSYLLLSVSNGATFDSGWKIWAMDVGLNGSTPSGLYGDFWRLGFDNAAIYLSGNMYSSSAGFQYAKIRVLKKSEVYTAATNTLNWKDIFNLKLDDGTTPADSLSPVHQRGKPSAINSSMLASTTTFTVPSTSMWVWKINDPLADTLAVTLSTVKGLLAYDFPAPFRQLNGITLDSGDSRMLKTIYRNGFLYTARDTGYPDQATTVTYDLVDTSTMTLTSQARLVNINAFYPAFDVPASTDPGTPFATTNVIIGTTTAPDGSLTYPSFSYNAGQAFLKAGEAPFNEPNARWGDYFGGAVDPVSGGLWVSGQYSKPPAPLGVWGTWVGFFPWNTTSTYSDVPSTSTYADFVNTVRSWQVATGCSTAAYCPTDLVKRGEVASLIIRSMFGDTFTYTQTPYFTDVPANSPYFPFVQKLRDLGMTTGCGAGSFCPNDPISRQDAAILIVRGKFKAVFGDQFTYPSTPVFTDVPLTSTAFPFIQKMSDLGITGGCGTGSFCPAGLLTRQETAVLITRAFLN